MYKAKSHLPRDIKKGVGVDLGGAKKRNQVTLPL